MIPLALKPSFLGAFVGSGCSPSPPWGWAKTEPVKKVKIIMKAAAAKDFKRLSTMPFLKFAAKIRVGRQKRARIALIKKIDADFLFPLPKLFHMGVITKSYRK